MPTSQSMKNLVNHNSLSFTTQSNGDSLFSTYTSNIRRTTIKEKESFISLYFKLMYVARMISVLCLIPISIIELQIISIVFSFLSKSDASLILIFSYCIIDNIDCITACNEGRRASKQERERERSQITIMQSITKLILEWLR